MFTTDAILLKKIPVSDGDSLYELFTKDFGKIRTWVSKKKRITPADHGSILHCTISTKQNRNSLESGTIKHAIKTDDLDYSSLIGILRCLQTTATITLPGVVNTSLFEDYHISLPFFETREKSERARELFLMKLFKTHGMGWKREIEKESIIFRKIYTNIEKYPLRAFFHIAELNDTILQEIRQMNQVCMSPYL